MDNKEKIEIEGEAGHEKEPFDGISFSDLADKYEKDEKEENK